MTTYTFTAYTEGDLLVAGDTNLSTGDNIVIPTSSSVTITVNDDDPFLSGDSWSNENANDSTGQTASITAPDGSEIGNGGQIYAEKYYWVQDSYGTWYVMIEVEQEGSSEQFYTFYTGSGYTAPAEGSSLYVCSCCNVTSDWIDYKCLDGGDMPASISGTFFQDNNDNDIDDAGDGDISGATVELYAWNGSNSYFAGTTTTDENGDYSFDGLAEGWYYVRFVNADANAEFVGKDVGGNDAIDSDVNSSGYTSWIYLNDGQQKSDVDAGVEAQNGWISGRLTFDADCNDNEWNDQTGAWDLGVANQVVQLVDLNGNVVAESTTDGNGNYMFDVPAGEYRVQFPLLEGYRFSAKDSGVDEHFDSDADANGLTDIIYLSGGQSIYNIDAGIKNELSDGDEASEVCETDNTVQLLNVLANTVDPEAGDPIVYAVSNGANGPMTGNVGVEVTGSNGGVFVINQDGSATFNDNGAFDFLNNGESATTSITYCVKDAAGKIVESTYTVTINGKNDTVTVDAVDDCIVVTESEGAGDLETLEDGASSILANDTEDGQLYTGQVIQVNGQTALVGDWVDLEKGRVLINADGTVDFDAAGDFEALTTGETDTVSVNYTIGSEAQSLTPQNVLLVIDISNSTVGLDGQNIFDGTGVGDVNNDGRADTVLDAQIVAAKALIDDLRAQGIDPALVNVGIVTFSGVDTTGASSYNPATVDSAVVGTFNLADLAIEGALDSILSGSWTNYEAGLSEAEAWFSGNAAAGDANTMYFLSDGRPITSFENGAYVEQDPSQFLDEVARIEANFGADIHAIGVGANSSLGILDQIDNTGGAVQVTDAASLTAALLEGNQTTFVQDTATVTIKVLGTDDIDAVNDCIVVSEDETAGDLEQTIDDQLSILANDTQDGGAYAGAVVEIEGQSANVGEWISLAGGGRVMVNANGTVDFDADGNGDGVSDFEALSTGDQAEVSFEYTISLPGSTTSTSRVIDFDGAEFSLGDTVSTQVQGVTISALRDGQTSGNAAMIFDSSNPTGGDTDLATGNLGKVLIITEDGDASDPDDNAGGGTFVFDFDAPSTVDSITFLDTEEPTPQVRFYDESGTLISSQNGPVTTDGGQETMAFNVDGVSRMEIEIQGSGAVDNIAFTETVETPGASDTATVTIKVNGINDLDDGDEAANVQEGSGLTALPINALANTVDPDGGVPVIDSLEGTALNGGSATSAGSNGGIFVFNADGSVSFDTNGQFGFLGEGQSVTTSVEYVVADGQGGFDTSLYTVTVIGTAGDPIIEANDDVVNVLETEGEGDTETLANGETSVLANDDLPFAASNLVVEVNGVAGNVGEFINLAGGGRVKLNADGTLDFDANGAYEALGNGDTAQEQLTYTVRSADGTANSVVGVFEGPNGLKATATVVELNGDLVVTLEVLQEGGDIGDIRGFFFDIANESLLPGLTATGADITEQKYDANNVTKLSNGNNINGQILIDLGPFDGAVGTGTAGIGGDDIRSTTFTLSHDTVALTLNEVLNQDMALRLTSVGDEGGSRDGSLKLGAVGLPSTSDSLVDSATVTINIEGINDLADEGETETVDEGSGITTFAVGALDNTVDPEAGDPVVTTVDNGTTSVAAGTQVAGDAGGLFTIGSDGTVTFDTNGDFEALNTGESAATTVTYTVQDAAGDTVTSTHTVVVNGIDSAANFTLSGNVQTGAAATRSLTFIIDHTLKTFSDAAAGSVLDLNGDGFQTVVDGMLTQIVDSVQGLDANQQINFILAGQTGVVDSGMITAGAIQGAAASANPQTALSALFGPIYDQPAGTETEQLDIALALDAAKTQITATDANGADIDDIIVLTSTNSVADFELVLDENGLPVIDPVTGLPVLNPLPFTDPTAVVDALTDAAGINADIDVVYIDTLGVGFPEVLESVDADGITDAVNDASPFGLDSLISQDQTISLGDIVSVTVDGVDFAVTDEDPIADGFQFTLAGLGVDPTTGTGVQLNIDEDNNPATIERVEDVTTLLTPNGTDSFEFNFDLG